MSIYSCQQLADDWQISPKAPVLTSNGGHSSLNFDNYDDLERGLQPPEQYPTQYPNVPDVFTSEVSVNPSMEYPEVRTILQSVPAGGVCWFEDGNYDFTSFNPGGFLDVVNANGTKENPTYYLARNKHQAFMIGDSGGWRWYSENLVIGGRVWDLSIGGPNRSVGTIFRNSYVRLTSEKLVGPSKGQLAVANQLLENQGPKHVEFDNIEIDGNNESGDTASTKLRIAGLTASPDVTVTNQHIRMHHIWMHDRTETAGGQQRWIMVGNGEKGDHGTSPEDPTWNDDRGEVKMHIENCLFDNFIGSFEAMEMKCCHEIMRNNTFTNGSEHSNRIRSGWGHQFSGNWCEDNDHGLFHSATEVVSAFNFVQRPDENNVRGAVVFHSQQRNFDGRNTMNYRPSSNSVYKHNVFSGFGGSIRATSNTVGLDVTGVETENLLLEGNRYYSTTPGDDTPLSGRYLRGADQGNGQGLTEVQFRALNEWGVNEYVGSLLPTQSNGIDASLFDGPGDDFSDARLSELYGKPSMIKMPSWWKLPV